jgi:arsenate reductase (thioredoxin)
MKKSVLFICTHNAARSQIAEGFLRALYGDRYEAYSAGTKVTQVSPFAVRVMAENGIDISRHRSKSISEFLNVPVGITVTLCDRARTVSPTLPCAKVVVHRAFLDPEELIGTEEEVLTRFRRTRDEIRRWIFEYFGPDNGE